MTRAETARCYTLVVGAYGLAPSEAAVEAWHEVIGDQNGDTAFEACRRLCRADSQYAPRPGQVRAEIMRMNGADGTVYR